MHRTLFFVCGLLTFAITQAHGSSGINITQSATVAHLPSTAPLAAVTSVDDNGEQQPSLLGTMPHCSVPLAARIGDKDINAEGQESSIRCFGSFAESIAYATKGKVKLTADAEPATLTKEEMASLASSNVVGIEFWDSNFEGSSLTFSSELTCNDVSYFYVGNLKISIPAWNDQISSSWTFAGCNHSYHYEHAWEGGAVLDCGTGCSNMGVMNDRSSSLRWFR